MVRQEICGLHNEGYSLFISANEKLIGPFEDMEEFLIENEKTGEKCFEKYSMKHRCPICEDVLKENGKKILSKKDVDWFNEGKELKKFHMII